MKIELLYFDGCPSWQTGLEKLKAALQMEQLDDSVELVKVKDDAEAARLKFLGSPPSALTAKIYGRKSGIPILSVAGFT